MSKHYIKKVVSYSMVGSLGFTIVAGLQGCGDSGPTVPPTQSNTNQESIAEAAQEGLFLVIQQTGTNPDTYELREKYPSSGGTRAILKDMEGNEKILSEEELKKLAESEAQRFENGESKLAQEPSAQSQGLSLGETILASAAGALIGGMIANKLMGNSNYQQHQQRQTQRAQTTASSTRNPAANRSNSTGNSQQRRSGFFGNNSSSNRSSSGRSSGFGG